jgi:hypothetical protein
MAEVMLPGGFELDGQWHRIAALRPLMGKDETFLAEEGSELSIAARSSELLARCLQTLGPFTAVNRELVGMLTVGDREALFLHLRRLTFGERMSCVLQCPEITCNAKMDLDLPVSELLQQPYPYAKEVHETLVEGGDLSYRVRFRLPNGSDQEAAAPLALTDAEAAADLILRRTIREIAELPGGQQLEQPPEAVKQALPDLMAKLDPQAELILKASCPECRRIFKVQFDVADYFQRELTTRVRDVYREVHLLALHYHWSEADILSLSARKRRIYLDLLASEVGP